jgi:hypothetical protein
MGWTNRQWDDYIRQQPGTFWGEYSREQSQRIKASRESSVPPAPSSRPVDRADSTAVLNGPRNSHISSTARVTQSSDWVSVVACLALIAMLGYARLQSATWGESALAGIVAGVATYLGLKVVVIAVAVALAVIRFVIKVLLYGALAIGLVYVAYLLLAALGS